MRTGKLLYIFVIALAGITGCGGSAPGTTAGDETTLEGTASGNRAGNSDEGVSSTDRLPGSDATTITFIHLNDLHAHLTPHKDLVTDGNGGRKVVERGGLARTASLIKSIRKENPDSVLMNIGDTYHGGVEALFTLGNAIVAPVNALGIDVGVPGNWDFGFSSTIFRLRYTDTPFADITGTADPLRPRFDVIERPNFPNLAANMTYKLTGKHVLPPTLTMEVGGVKIGFIGLTSDIVQHVYPLLAPAFEFTGYGEAAETAEARYRELIDGYAEKLRNEGARIVVVMSELGIHKDHRLAQIVKPGAVDVFFSAHTHEATFVPLRSASGALVVEAGNDGYLGRMDITLRGGQVTSRHWRLLEITPDLPEDPTVQALVDRARAPFLAGKPGHIDPMPNSALALVQPIDTVIGHTPYPLDRRDALESTFNNALTDILRHYAGTDVALGPGFRFDAVVAETGALLEDNTVADGAVTLEDIYRFFPLMFTIARGEVSGGRLKEILEESLNNTFSGDAFDHKGGWLEALSGLGVTVDLSGPPGQRVLDLRLKDSGTPVRDDMMLTVAGCKRPIEPRDILCRHRGFQNVTPLLKSGTGEPWTVIDLLIEGIATGVVFDASRKDIVDLSGSRRWPDTPFIQPLSPAL